MRDAPVKEWPKMSSWFGTRSFGVVVFVMDSLSGSISSPRLTAWSACMLYCLCHLCAIAGASRVLVYEPLARASELNVRRVLRCSISFVWKCMSGD